MLYDEYHAIGEHKDHHQDNHLLVGVHQQVDIQMVSFHKRDILVEDTHAEDMGQVLGDILVVGMLQVVSDRETQHGILVHVPQACSHYCPHLPFSLLRWLQEKGQNTD